MKDGKVVLLLIDDAYPDYQFQMGYIHARPDVEILSTTELEEGERLFDERSGDIDIIVIDHAVIGGTTPELIRKMKASGFRGLIIGVSYTNIKDMKAAGCDYCCDRNRLFKDEMLEISGHLDEEIEKVKGR